MVGAVLVHNGCIIGEGWHQQYGQAHAEVNCLNAVDEKDKHLIADSTMYVSLEPCAHFGKTPPCAHRLVKEGIKNVVICNTDPFAQVDGKGIEILKQSGATVTTGILADAGEWINRRFFCMHTQHRPYIILKWAQTLDGYIAPEDGSRYQISNEQSSTLVHKWRTEESAIMVGYNTAVNDNPQLTARHWEGNNPLRIVIDKNLSLAISLKLFDNEASTWVLNTQKEDVQNSTHYIKLDFSTNIIPQLLERLYRTGKQSLIVEGGPMLLQSFIDAGLWDEARVFTAPKLLNNGIAAPILHHPALTTEIGTDKLELFVNPTSKYPYANGLEL